MSNPIWNINRIWISDLARNHDYFVGGINDITGGSIIKMQLDVQNVKVDKKWMTSSQIKSLGSTQMT